MKKRQFKERGGGTIWSMGLRRERNRSASYCWKVFPSSLSFLSLVCHGFLSLPFSFLSIFFFFFLFFFFFFFFFLFFFLWKIYSFNLEFESTVSFLYHRKNSKVLGLALGRFAVRLVGRGFPSFSSFSLPILLYSLPSISLEDRQHRDLIFYSQIHLAMAFLYFQGNIDFIALNMRQQ